MMCNPIRAEYVPNVVQICYKF